MLMRSLGAPPRRTLPTAPGAASLID